VNEDAAVQAVYTVINANEATLISGLLSGGTLREVSHLTPTILYTPAAYYAVGVHCERAREHDHPGLANVTSTANSPDYVEYPMLVRVADAVYSEPNEDIPYDVAHSNFRKFTDRLVRLLRETTVWFPDAATRPRFRVKEDRTLGKVFEKNNVAPFIETDAYVLGAEIRFVLVDWCSDSSLI
jgi:hypothetical protein